MRQPAQILTPRMYGLLQRIQRAQRVPLHALTPQRARSAYASAVEILDLPRAALQRVEDIRLPAADGAPLQARLYCAVQGSAPALL